MGTKNNPAPFDCYANAADDEPMFVLLARDKAAAVTVADWIAHRVRMNLNATDDAQITEAYDCLRDMIAWREANR